MEQEIHNHPPDPDPDQKPIKADKKSVPSGETRPRVRAWMLWAAIAAVLMFFAQIVQGVDHNLISIALLLAFFASCAAARALWVQLVNNGAKHLNANLRAGSIVLAASVVCFFLLWWSARPQPKPYPPLTVSFTTVELPDEHIQLTNDFLERKDFSTNFAFQGFLFVPLKFGDTNFLFFLSVRHESDSPLPTAENVELVLSVPKDLPCIPDPRWEPVTLRNDERPANEKYAVEKSWVFPFAPILVGLGKPTPPVLMSQSIADPRPFFSILLRAKNAPAKAFAFLVAPLWLPSNAPPHKAFVLKGEPIGPQHTLNVRTERVMEELSK